MMESHLEAQKRSQRTAEENSAPIRRTDKKVGRNDPCPCNSGKKFKHCHGA